MRRQRSGVSPMGTWLAAASKPTVLLPPMAGVLLLLLLLLLPPVAALDLPGRKSDGLPIQIALLPVAGWRVVLLPPTAGSDGLFLRCGISGGSSLPQSLGGDSLEGGSSFPPSHVSALRNLLPTASSGAATNMAMSFMSCGHSWM